MKKLYGTLLLTAVISIHIVARFFMKDAYTFSPADYLNNTTPAILNSEIIISNPNQGQTELTAAFPKKPVTENQGFSTLFITAYRSF